MNPAPSVIAFTTLSGLGFGFLAFMAADPVPVHGLHAFALWALGYVLAVGGLLISALHLGNPKRALLAFTQWRSSWLSREAVAAVATLLALAPVALSQIVGFDWPRLWGLLAALMCFATVFATAMIYAQLKTVPRWNHWITPVMYLTFAATGGAILAGQGAVAMLALAALSVVQAQVWRIGDKRFAQSGATTGTATGLGSIGTVRVFEQPHTGQNYLMREMIFTVARKHVEKLRIITLVLVVVIPLLLLTLAPHGPVTLLLTALIHLGGAITSRWLFFAEAEHVVGLYYGRR